MKKIVFIPALLLVQLLFSQTLQQLEAKRVGLPNGWSLTPIGKSLALGDLPLNMAVSPSKRFIAVTNNGQSVQSLQLIDAVNNKVLHNKIIPRSWYGLKFSSDERFLYASGGNDNWILKYAIVKDTLALKDSIKLGPKWPYKLSPTGIELDDAKKILYVGTKENNSLYFVDLASKTIKDSIKLEGEVYGCLLSPDKRKLYVSVWGNDEVLVINTSNRKIQEHIKVGDNPNELCLTKNGKYLFVGFGP